MCIRDSLTKCLNIVKRNHSELWGNESHPRNNFVTDRQINPSFVNFKFNWTITLHGTIDNFVLSADSVFPQDVHDEVFNLYLDYHAKNNGVIRLKSQETDSHKYNAISVKVLQNNFPEFRRADYMPKTKVQSSIVSGHELKMMSGEKNQNHDFWNTNYSAIGCRKYGSLFIKLKIEYKSEWLARYFDHRDVAFLHILSLIHI